MSNLHSFSIQQSERSHIDAECPVCGDSFTVFWLAVHNVNIEQISNLCAWENAPELASLIYLHFETYRHNRRGVPDDINKALKQRKSHPKRHPHSLR